MKKSIFVFLLLVTAIEFSDAQVITGNNKFKDILLNNLFYCSNGLTSLISFDFTADNQYIMRVVAVSQGEVVNVRGTFQFVRDGNKSYLKLAPLRVNKSAAYNNFQDFRIDNFIKNNVYYLLRKFTDYDVKKYASENILLAQSNADKNESPVYILEGRNNFYSEKKLTQAEKDAIVNKKINEKKKKADLEDKLKGW